MENLKVPEENPANQIRNPSQRGRGEREKEKREERERDTGGTMRVAWKKTGR